MDEKEITLTKSGFRLYGLTAIRYMDAFYSSLIDKLDVSDKEKVNMLEDYSQQRDLILVYQNIIEGVLFDNEHPNISENDINEISQAFGDFKSNISQNEKVS